MKLGIGYFQRMETQAKTVLIRSCLIFLRNSAWILFGTYDLREVKGGGERRTTDATLRISFVFSAPPHITQISFYIATYRNPSLYTFLQGLFLYFLLCGIFSCWEPQRRVGLGGRPPILSEWVGLFFARFKKKLDNTASKCWICLFLSFSCSYYIL